MSDLIARAEAMARHLRVSGEWSESPQHKADCNASADTIEQLLAQLRAVA